MQVQVSKFSHGDGFILVFADVPHTCGPAWKTGTKFSRRESIARSDSLRLSQQQAAADTAEADQITA
jgi:hypothetical protein